MIPITQAQLQDPIKAKTIVNDLFEKGIVINEESRSWPLKYINGCIYTRLGKRSKDPYKFHQRSSIHHPSEVTYDQLRDILYVNHTQNAPKYETSLEESVLLGKVTSESEVYWLGFSTPFLSYSREFLQLIAGREEGRRFMVVSQPVDYPNVKPRKGYVRGKYLSWETVEEIEDGKVEWTCVLQGIGGGYVPGFVADYYMGRDLHKNAFAILKRIQQDNKVKEKH